LSNRFAEWRWARFVSVVDFAWLVLSTARGWRSEMSFGVGSSGASAAALIAIINSKYNILIVVIFKARHGFNQ
jgi:hypothetical protein